MLSPSCANLLAFERLGHFTHRELLPAERVAELMPAANSAWEEQQLEVHQQKLRVILGQEELDRMDDPKAKPNARLAALKKELSALPEGAIPFMQGFNLWRTCAELRELAASPELAGTASQLLGCDRVRLYQDSIFVKRPGDGTTHWHSDLAMAPLDTNQFVTCWLPCQAVPAEEEGGSGLVFASGSHRDTAFHHWYAALEALEDGEELDVSDRGYRESVPGALAVGDATWHHGWTLHTANSNPLPYPRVAIAFSYFADGAKRLPRKGSRSPHAEDAESYAAWAEGQGAVKPGHPARHELLPLVWAKGGAQPLHAPEGRAV